MQIYTRKGPSCRKVALAIAVRMRKKITNGSWTNPSLTQEDAIVFVWKGGSNCENLASEKNE
jgi:hypothetical protein